MGKRTTARLASRLRLLMLAVAVVLVAVAALSNRATSRRGLHVSDDETAEKCASSPIADPLDLQEKWQASLYGLGFLYICLGIAMVCEEYFVTALNELIDVNGISPDVAGATFMAAGSSSPEVFAALIGLFFSSSEGGGAGVGTVVGSAVFNVLVIIGGAALYSDRGITLEWRTLLRDAGFYAASLVALYVCFDDGVLSAAEAACMVGLYFVYLVVCAFFGRVVGCLCPEKKKLTGKAQSSSSGTTAYQDLEKENRITGFALGDDRAAADMVRALMVRMEKDRYVLFKEARRAIVAPYFGTHNASKNMASDMAHATMQERATLRKAFDVFDHSKTGVINPGDISGMLAHLGVDADSELVADLWAVLDSAKDNKVTFDEFAPVYANWHRYGLRQAQKLMLKPEELQKVRAVFDRLDVSRSGWLSQPEMDAAFEQLLGTEEGAGLVDRLMVVRMFKHAGGDRHEMTFDAFKALYVQWFGYSGALYDADTAKLGAAQGEHVPNASAAAVVAEHGEHALLQWPSTTGARLNYVAGFPFALLFHFTVPNCAVARWRAYYPLTMLASIAWLGALVFFMISWAEKAGCMLGISETLLGLTVCAIGTSGPDAIASLIVAKEGNGVMAVSNAFGSNVFDILFGLGFPFLLKTLITGEDFAVSTEGLTESIYIMFGCLFLFLAICMASKLVVSRSLGSLFLVIYGVYLAFTIATNV